MTGKPKARGYSEAGASWSRRALKGFVPSSSSPNEDINWNLYTLRQRARMLYMAAPMATSAIDTNRTKAIGTGLVCKPALLRNFLRIEKQNARDWETKTSAEFELWADSKACDALGLNSFSELQQLAFKSWLMSGDVFALIERGNPSIDCPYTLRLRLVEADRVSTPWSFTTSTSSIQITDGQVPEGQAGAGHKIFDGVEVDEQGRVVAYYVCDAYPNQVHAKTPQWTRVLAVGAETGERNVLHIMSADRPDQYRGVPLLAPVIEPLLQLRRYTESELMAALVQSFFTAWIETEDTPSDFPLNEVGGAGAEIPQAENEYEMGPGIVTHLASGEKIVFGNPNIPTAGFETFVKAICREIGAALEIPYDVLTKEFDSSYSASRAALMEAWEAVKMRRQWFINDFCQPIYNLWLSEAVAIGRVQAPGFFRDPILKKAYCNCRWIGPTAGQLDPRKEIDAALEQINAGIKTREQVTREMGGGDWENNVDLLAVENVKLAKANAVLKPDKIEPEGEEDKEDDH